MTAPTQEKQESKNGSKKEPVNPLVKAVCKYATTYSENGWAVALKKSDDELSEMIGGARTENGAIKKVQLAMNIYFLRTPAKKEKPEAGSDGPKGLEKLLP